MTVIPGPSRDSSQQAPTGLPGRIAFIVGSIGLLAAMSTDALAVLGRHIGLPLLGSIEIVQASVVLLASAAMVGTTLSNKHARAHLLVDRLSARGRRWLLAGSDAISAAVFFCFAAGSLWIALELWHGHEHSELLHIPWSWLRFVWIASSLLIGIVFLVRALRRADSPS
jgi:TRAP-type C4-dicarboxylate transport system permease small subunit